MSRIDKSEELTIIEYIQKIGLNPDNVRYQRIPATRVGIDGADWTTFSINKRALLLSLGYIDWKPTITKFRADGITPENFVNNGIFASFKPGLPFTNAMNHMSLSINSGRTQSKMKLVLKNVESISTALEYFYSDQDRFPSVLEFQNKNVMEIYLDSFPPTEVVFKNCQQSLEYKRPKINSYELYFCLPKKVDGFKAGWNKQIVTE